ncbi:MAG TPA: tetratricopeptide repeat protein [Candidatus Acidoferrum sp.]|nr:tetratricopeptide repeat protein [Candidatus Acidoferrum sp.]
MRRLFLKFPAATWSLGWVLLLATSALTSSASPQAASQSSGKGKLEVQSWFEQGETALQNGDLDAAEAAFRRVLTASPQAGAAYSNLGVIAMRRKEWEQALRLLEKAKRLEPKVAGIRLNIGLVEYRRGDYGAAIEPLASVVRDQPDSQQARYLLGLCNFFTGHFEEAVRVLESLWPQMSGDAVYLYVYCIAAHNAGEKDADEKALAQLLAVGTDTPEFHLILAKAYVNHKDYTRAVDELNVANAANPNLPFVHFNLGFVYMRTSEFQLAMEEFLKDIAIEPDVAENYEQLAMLYSRMGRDADAEKAFQDAIQRDPKMAGAHFGLAKLHMKQEKYAEALRSIDIAVRLTPDNQNVHFLRGQVLKRLGREQESRAEMAKAQKIFNATLESDRNAAEDERMPNPELTKEPQ